MMPEIPREVRRMLISGDAVERMLPSLGQRERATLGAMAKSGRIGSAELISANRFAEEYVMAEHGVFDRSRSQTTVGPRLFQQEARVAVMKKYQASCAALGPSGHRRMVALLGDGKSVLALSRVLGHRSEIVTGLVMSDLGRLVEHYSAEKASRRHLN